MGRAKEIIVKKIPSKIGIEFVKKFHYSGSVTANSQLYLGCFLDDKLHGVMSFGPPMDRSKVLNLVHDTNWNEMIELNRLVFDDYLPKNSESRCISIAIKLLKKNAPQIKWILSFSDGTQCGDGTIYRASGFMLTQIKKSNQIVETPSGERITRLTLTQQQSLRRKKLLKELNLIENGKSSISAFLENGCKMVEGFQLRYIYLIDKNCELNCPTIPFDKIQEVGASMYKGEKIERIYTENNKRD
jgi:hypothetical protein